MMACWINHPDGIALLDEQANLRGILIELPIQRVGQTQGRLQKPSEWFKIDDNLSRERNLHNRICQVTTEVV